MAQSSAAPRRQARPRRAVAFAAALSGCALAAHCALQLFVAPGARPAVRSAVARRAEGDEKKDEGGFMKFLKVEQDIELSPEEYELAMEQEITSLRKRYYIGGVVKEGNLIVPWKPVEEKQLEKDARRNLKKNGIADPEGGSNLDEEDSKVDAILIGEQDVRLDWAGGAPGTKVGYIVERKRAADMNFQEIATYENMATSYLLAKQFAGHEYQFLDDLLKPGSYSYRVLCRYRSGDIKVIDKKDITVPELSGIDSGAALIVFGIVTVIVVGASFFLDPAVK
mmetsp:Transcript_39480/g.104361  ORF Transcript_39480/g.104361 Transcript_39480/m.104361 type:complete len:281 (+) Transcript_39480:102-944(+)